MKGLERFITILIFCLSVGIMSVNAQTAEFTDQGKLTDSSMPADASYDLEFKLFDAETGGTETGTQTRLGVAVSNGTCAVRLDCGESGFGSSPRFLGIFVKPAGGSTFTPLAPRIIGMQSEEKP